jgi:hypothetical protein
LNAPCELENLSKTFKIPFISVINLLDCCTIVNVYPWLTLGVFITESTAASSEPLLKINFSAVSSEPGSDVSNKIEFFSFF